MIVNNKSRRTVLLLGAGASRGAVKHIVVNKKRIRPPLNADFFAVAETLARASGPNTATSNRLRRLKKLFKTDLPAKWPPPMETAFSLLYTAKDFPEIYASRPGRKPSAGERQELNDFLALLFDMLTVLDKKSDSNGYDRMVSVLEAEDTIITLNYDTLLDSALVRHGWDPQIGYLLSGGLKKIKWASDRAVSAEPLEKVHLLKLHGSLNWWVRGTPATLSNVFSKKPVLVTAPRVNEPAKMIRQIIPPIYGKVFAHSHWRRLWKAAFNALSEAEQLVVVGCSIVETDYHLQALLRRSVKERKKAGVALRAILVDRTRIRRRWQRVLRGAHAQYEAYNNLELFLTKGARV